MRSLTSTFASPTKNDADGRSTAANAGELTTEPMTKAATTETSRRLARAIDQNRDAIERRWLVRVKEDLDRCNGIELTHLRDGMPDYLAGLVRLLSGDDVG